MITCVGIDENKRNVINTMHSLDEYELEEIKESRGPLSVYHSE